MISQGSYDILEYETNINLLNQLLHLHRSYNPTLCYWPHQLTYIDPSELDTKVLEFNVINNVLGCTHDSHFNHVLGTVHPLRSAGMCSVSAPKCARALLSVLCSRPLQKDDQGHSSLRSPKPFTSNLSIDHQVQKQRSGCQG